MSESDKNLIKKAEEMPYIDWAEISALVNEAESSDAKTELILIRTSKRHKEEASCQNL